MSRVRLDREWTDADGTTHAVGETVDVDDDTLAELREAGIVADAPTPDQGWAGPTARQEDDAPEAAARDIDDTELG
jgi:hypothetical protein